MQNIMCFKKQIIYTHLNSLHTRSENGVFSTRQARNVDVIFRNEIAGAFQSFLVAIHRFTVFAGVRSRNVNKEIVMNWRHIPQYGVVIKTESALAEVSGKLLLPVGKQFPSFLLQITTDFIKNVLKIFPFSKNQNDSNNILY